MVLPLNSRPLIELISYGLWLQWPTVATHLRHDLVVVLQTPVLGSVLICFSVEHKRVHRSLDLPWVLSFLHFSSSILCRSVHICFNVHHRNVGPIFRQFAQRLLEPGHSVFCLDFLLLDFLWLRRSRRTIRFLWRWLQLLNRAIDNLATSCAYYVNVWS